MFFGDAFAGSLFNLFATHPPLDERIRLLDPNFDGSYPPTEPLPDAGGRRGSRRRCREGSAAGFRRTFHAGRGACRHGLRRLVPARRLPSGQVSTDRDRIVGQVGSPRGEHLQHAGRLVAGLPAAVVQAVREPYAARASFLPCS